VPPDLDLKIPLVDEVVLQEADAALAGQNTPYYLQNWLWFDLAFQLKTIRSYDEFLGFRSGKRLEYLVVDRKQQHGIEVNSETVAGFREYSQILLTDEYALVHQDSLVRIYRLRHHGCLAQ